MKEELKGRGNYNGAGDTKNMQMFNSFGNLDKTTMSTSPEQKHAKCCISVQYIMFAFGFHAQLELLSYMHTFVSTVVEKCDVEFMFHAIFTSV